MSLQKASPSQQNLAMNDLMRALRLVKKAKENNVPLSSSTESIALEQLAAKPKNSCWTTVRWIFYFFFWTVAVAFLVALLNRNKLCPILSPED